jgi:hypothetical protein
VALAPFVVSVRKHRQIEETIRRDARRLVLREAQIARLELDWIGIPEATSLPVPKDHPFARDLDLVGSHSLHRLVDTAVSVEGSRRLQDWLLDTEPVLARTEKRQELVRELVDLASFREELQLSATLAAAGPGEKWPGERLVDWLKGPIDTTPQRRLLTLLVPLSIINIVLAILNAVGLLPAVWLVSWILYGALSATQLRANRFLFHDAFYLRDGLMRLGAIFGYLERYDYSSKSLLGDLCMPFREPDKRPSQQLRMVIRTVSAIGMQKNPVLWFWLNALVPWDIFAAYQLNRSKAALAELLPLWLDIWYELEALNSMANFAYLNPGCSFPTIVAAAQTDRPRFLEAEAMGHPLIAAEERVLNDITMPMCGSIRIITGSNMAGKSTFLRTIGTNLALAYAGGPAIARSLSTPQFRLFTAIRVTDSVTDGFSYFYAEVRRLSTLLLKLKEEEELPLFFLIDEIFRGTNNRERLIGSRAYVRELANSNGSGIIATHDLELVSLESQITGVSNYHFRDNVQDGRMIFDYKLHHGPCPTTNALRIMRLAGLPVTPET